MVNSARLVATVSVMGGVVVSCLLAGCGGGIDMGDVGLLKSGVNPGVFPPSSVPYGKTYGQWSAVWWQWAEAIPIEENPLADTTGEHAGVGQTGPVWFLAGTTGGTAERTCAVPTDKAILFPIVNIFGAIPMDATTEEALPPLTADVMNHVTALEAKVDGVALQGLMNYRFASPFFTYTSPDAEHALWPDYAGTHRAQADGFWIMLEPLSAGSHTIFFRGKFVFPPSDLGGQSQVFETQVTYHLTVE